MPGQRFSAHKEVVSRLLPIVLAGLVVACQGTATGNGQFTPPYLRLRLCGGEAQVRWSDSSEWTAMEGEISVDGSGEIVADAAEGARFCLGDGSTFELAPGVTIGVQNPRVFPRLRVTLSDGSLLFEARQPSYEFVVPVGSVTMLDVPARVRIGVSGDTTHVLVEEGAVACSLETRTLTLLACWEMYAVAVEEGEEPVEPVVIDYCAANATAGPPTLTPLPSPTRWEAEPTVTPTLSPTPSSTPSPTLTPTRRGMTRTPTPMPVTAPPPTAPPATAPPPPPPTDEPPPPTDEPPPPTDEPPPPTDEPPPPPTEPPTRPTVSSS